MSAGEAAGRVGAAAGLPLPYRGQPQPALPPMHDLEGLPGPCKGYALRRCMTRSTIAPGPHRHASLGLDTYVQVTSPIRRHTDLVAHFNLKVRGRWYERCSSPGARWCARWVVPCSLCSPLPPLSSL